MRERISPRPTPIRVGARLAALALVTLLSAGCGAGATPVTHGPSPTPVTHGSSPTPATPEVGSTAAPPGQEWRRLTGAPAEIVALGDGRLVLGGEACQGGNEPCLAALWSSPTGANWARAGLEDVHGAVSRLMVRHGGGYLALGFEYRELQVGVAIGGVIWRSDDGEQWTRASTGEAFALGPCREGCPDFHAAASGPLGDLIVAFDSNVANGVAWTSRDGLTWKRAVGSPPLPTDGPGGRWDAATVGNDLFIVGGADCAVRVASCRGATWTSADGGTWERTDLDTEGDAQVRALGRVSTGYVALVTVSRDGVIHGEAWTSNEGRSWQRSADLGSFEVAAPLASVSGGLVAVGRTQNPDRIRVLWSLNGLGWEERPTSAFAIRNVWVRDLAAWDGRVAAAGWGGDPTERYLWLSPP